MKRKWFLCTRSYTELNNCLTNAVYSPDPYVSVRAMGTPNGEKKTEHVCGTSDPEWNQVLVFYIDAHRDRLLGET